VAKPQPDAEVLSDEELTNLVIELWPDLMDAQVKPFARIPGTKGRVSREEKERKAAVEKFRQMLEQYPETLEEVARLRRQVSELQGALDRAEQRNARRLEELNAAQYDLYLVKTQGNTAAAKASKLLMTLLQLAALTGTAPSNIVHKANGVVEFRLGKFRLAVNDFVSKMTVESPVLEVAPRHIPLNFSAGGVQALVYWDALRGVLQYDTSWKLTDYSPFSTSPIEREIGRIALGAFAYHYPAGNQEIIPDKL
jgi:hypothetical protein